MRRVFAVAALAVLVACGAREPHIAAGTWRLAIDHPGGELPVTLELLQNGADWQAVLVNGSERMPAETTRVSGALLEFAFPSYGASTSATLGDDGRLHGTVRLARKVGPVDLPFVATPGERHRFFAAPRAAADDLSGRWAVTISMPDGRFARDGIGEFTQRGSVVEGTFMLPQGDYRYLAGELRDRTLYLSTFDGGQASLWLGELAADGTMSGTFHSVTYGDLAWRARRDADAALPDPTTLTFLKPGFERVTFRFPDVEGREVSLDDPRFAGKVVLVTTSGSWCPTCHDEAAFLAPWFREHSARGVEIVSLMYEHSADRAEAVQAVRNFQRRYDIGYDLLIAGTSDKDSASASLPMLNAMLVYPTLIAIDRRGQVRRIHTGFPGPATGEHHARFRRDFEALMNELISEST